MPELRIQVGQYAYLPGMQDLLERLSAAGHEMHVVSNYPEWYRWIEGKLQLSQYMPWTFVSCEGPIQVRARAAVALPWLPCSTVAPVKFVSREGPIQVRVSQLAV